jgi:CRISPR-associated endonuclease Csn1
MREVERFVFSTNRHPAEGQPGANDNGPLYRSESIREAQLRREIDEQTNNRLVRHRLLILERLHNDILQEFAGHDPTRVSRVTIEVNRDLREMSGKTNKAIKQELGIRLGNFKHVSEKLEHDLKPHGIRATAGLIRKARIADDLGWKCPYTGQSFDALALHARTVDKDHIIPRSLRPSDSLDSLVITFSEVNRMKGGRTALQFVQEFAGQPVQGMPGLHVQTPRQYEELVNSLESRRGHPDDQRRKKKRKELLLLEKYVEKEFTPRDLTQTSQLVRMGAQVLERVYLGNSTKPVITSLPGSVTGNIRKAWNLTACLSLANPLVLNPEDLDSNGNPRPHAKTEIRGITHLHHALDACVLAFASLFLPRDGGIWEFLIKRRLNMNEAAELRKRIGGMVQIAADGSFQIADLPNFLKEQIRHRLAEKRVYQHTPTRKRGLRVEQNAWRVVQIREGEAVLRQRMRQADGTRTTKNASEKVGKVLGLNPVGGGGKLQKLKAGLVIRDNYGLALDPEPQIIPFHKVHQRISELTRKNGGKPPRVLRNGMLIEITRRSGKADYRGVWKIFSLKNNSSGLAVDMGWPDVVALKNKTLGHKINVNLRSLLDAGIRLCDCKLVGIPLTTAQTE